MTNVYRIGVQIAMASNGAQLLGVLSRHLTGVHGQVKGLEGGFNKLKLAIGGALAIGAGAAIIGAFKGPLEEARKFEMAVGRFSRFGLGPERTREAAEFAKAMNIAGATYTENMTRMAEAQGVFRESGLKGEDALRGAKMAAPTLAKIDFANRGLDEESQARMHTSALAMLRFIEMRGGVNSPERFNQIANAGFKAITSSGGSVNWENLRQFMTRGGTAAQGLTDDVLFGKFEPIITEMKGSTAGTALMTSYGRLSGAQRLPNQIAHALVGMGIWDGSKIEWNSQGGIKRIKGGEGGLPGNPMRDLAGFTSDPFAWYEKNVRSVYETKNITAAERARDNFAIFGRTGGAMFNVYERQRVPVMKSVDAQRAAMGIDAAYGVAGGTLNGKMVDLHARWTNLMERLGEAVLPMAVKGLEVLVPALEKLTNWVGKHPGEVRAFAKGAIVIGAALIGLGTVALAVAAGAAILAGGPVVVFAAATGAVIGAVVALVALNWGALAKGFKMLYDQFAFMVTHPIKFAMGERPADSVPAKPGGHWTNNFDPMFGTTRRVWVADARPSAVPPPTQRAANTNTPGTVYMDGAKVGRIVSRHQAGALGGNMAATGRHDPGATLASPAAGGTR